jgi:NitT/TauT family transport system permease protein
MNRAATAVADVPPLSFPAVSGFGAGTLRRVGLPVLIAVAFLIAWQAFVVGLGIPRVIVPTPVDVAFAIVKHRAALVDNIPATVFTALAGFLIATAGGVLLAAAMTSFRLLRDAVYPCLVAFQLIPKIALAPIFIIWFGLGVESRLAFTVFISFFPILVATADGMEAMERSLMKLCRSLNASRLRILVHVQLPTSIPFMLSGMKVAITMAVIGTVIGEFITSRAGLGYLILNAASRAETDLIMASIVVLCVCGLVLYGMIEALDRVLMSWIHS